MRWHQLQTIQCEVIPIGLRIIKGCNDNGPTTAKAISIE